MVTQVATTSTGTRTIEDSELLTLLRLTAYSRSSEAYA